MHFYETLAELRSRDKHSRSSWTIQHERLASPLVSFSLDVLFLLLSRSVSIPVLDWW